MDFELRKWQETDAKNVVRYANNKKIADNLRNAFPFPYTMEDAKKYVLACMNHDESLNCFRAITIDNSAVGSIGIFVKDDIYCKSEEIGYWLGEPFWGNHIMSEAVKKLCETCFTSYDIVRIFAEPFAHNRGSRTVLENAGFTLEGICRKGAYKNGEFLDYCIYALLKE